MLDLSRKAVPWMVLSVVLFIVLSPGVLLTVPSINGSLANMWTPKVPSTQVVVHAFVCAIVLNLAGGVLKKMGLLEKFRDRSIPKIKDLRSEAQKRIDREFRLAVLREKREFTIQKNRETEERAKVKAQNQAQDQAQYLAQYRKRR